MAGSVRRQIEEIKTITDLSIAYASLLHLQHSSADDPSYLEALSAFSPSLTLLLPSFPSAVLHAAATSRDISYHIRQPKSGVRVNNFFRWLYDTFQSNDPALQLLVLHFIPVRQRLPLQHSLPQTQAGFEAVLLVIYAHETPSHGGEPVTFAIAAADNPNINDLKVAVLEETRSLHGREIQWNYYPKSRRCRMKRRGHHHRRSLITPGLCLCNSRTDIIMLFTVTNGFTSFTATSRRRTLHQTLPS